MPNQLYSRSSRLTNSASSKDRFIEAVGLTLSRCITLAARRGGVPSILLRQALMEAGREGVYVVGANPFGRPTFVRTYGASNRHGVYVPYHGTGSDN